MLSNIVRTECVALLGLPCGGVRTISGHLRGENGDAVTSARACISLCDPLPYIYHSAWCVSSGLELFHDEFLNVGFNAGFDPALPVWNASVRIACNMESTTSVYLRETGRRKKASKANGVPATAS